MRRFLQKVGNVAQNLRVHVAHTSRRSLSRRGGTAERLSRFRRRRAPAGRRARPGRPAAMRVLGGVG